MSAPAAGSILDADCGALCISAAIEGAALDVDSPGEPVLGADTAYSEGVPVPIEDNVFGGGITFDSLLILADQPFEATIKPRRRRPRRKSDGPPPENAQDQTGEESDSP
jgi:hypothetical protein